MFDDQYFHHFNQQPGSLPMSITNIMPSNNLFRVFLTPLLRKPN
ncbi:hypothetical protein XBKB1_3450001 [Xenorhabdus bovienii str. kraussei Becker Underwood]|uniref:Uncharacterized protein n=1 Tax=Xenorhabdus bovienii str. kraussei Becker Underwood TaxID=1398204 RepID=A0A077PWA7_XENBV|nr:hypothetical protein XBKB1_3450001 [Xenorhabdus bovienii str. kraussei Becker Underwood]